MNLTLFCITIGLLIMLNGTAIAFENDTDKRIQQIEIECSFSNAVPFEVKDKLKATLQRTLTAVLIETDDQSIESLKIARDEVLANIMDGLNIVFRPRGYQVESFDLDIGETTYANLALGNYGASVKSLEIELNTGNFHGFWEHSLKDMLHRAKPDLMEYYAPILIGLPVNAEHRDWAYNLVKDECENTSILNHVFYDMDAGVSIKIRENAIISISLQPSGHTIKTLRVRPYSRSMFQLALDPLKELITSNSFIVVGMPFSWLEANQDKIENEFCRIISDDPISRKFQMVSTCRLYVMERDPDALYLEFKVESNRWNFRAEMVVDIGNDENPTEFEGHLGMMLGGGFESFILLNFFPDTIRFRPDIGLGLHLFHDTFMGAGWDINNRVGKLYFTQYITPYTKIQAEVFTEDVGQDQFGITYKPYQFVSFGLFTDGDSDYWLRASFAF